MDRASQIAREAMAFAQDNYFGRMDPGNPLPEDYEAAFAEMLRKYFPVTKRKARTPRGRRTR